ncbi:BQ5605_C030g10762 [Microbotryum silenes-dioicae]|uniref:BQ5605_C030g10762 protein n=1 Tax=Microbotryum silenes-dioicae TaxID=796604 RepID=A0A2X0MI03_9BASI|nr:BQ5605_C030g10762 [Microbotryum silenes-dioicae]
MRQACSPHLSPEPSGEWIPHIPKHARLDGPKSFTNWLFLNGVIPATWTTAEQLPARDNTDREIIVGSIDSADVSAALDAIPSDELSAPRIFATLNVRIQRVLTAILEGAKGGYKATTASSWVKVKPLRANSAAQIKARRAPNADSNGR